RQRADDVVAGDRPRPDVVQRAIVRLADHGVDGAHAVHAGPGEQPVDHGVGGAPDAQRAGEQDRRLQLAQLAHLGDTDELAEAVADHDRGRDALTEPVVAGRQDRGDAGVAVVAADGGVADAYAGDVGDRVVR